MSTSKYRFNVEIATTIAFIVCIAVIIFGMVTLGMAFVNILTRPLPVATSEHLIVKAVCDYAYNSGEGGQACGIAQDVSSTIYTCNNKSIQPVCVVKDNVIEVRE